MQLLMATRAGAVQITHDPEGTTTVTHLEYADVSTPEGVAALLERAMRQRSVAQTAMNEQSSRSHMVFMLAIEGGNQGTSQRVQGERGLAGWFAGAGCSAMRGALADTPTPAARPPGSLPAPAIMLRRPAEPN